MVGRDKYVLSILVCRRDYTAHLSQYGYLGEEW